MTDEKALGVVAAASEGEDQNPTYQEENQIVNIIPDIDQARQAIRNWAVEYSARMKQHGDAAEPPVWPAAVMPWWAAEALVSFVGSGEASVMLARNFGQTIVSALLTVIVDVDPRWAYNHPDAVVGDFSQEPVEVTIVGPHEGMTLSDAASVFDSLAEATALLRKIEAAA